MDRRSGPRIFVQHFSRTNDVLGQSAAALRKIKTMGNDLRHRRGDVTHAGPPMMAVMGRLVPRELKKIGPNQSLQCRAT
jgi:hypothetical protein